MACEGLAFGRLGGISIGRQVLVISGNESEGRLMSMVHELRLYDLIVFLQKHVLYLVLYSFDILIPLTLPSS